MHLIVLTCACKSRTKALCFQLYETVYIKHSPDALSAGVVQREKKKICWLTQTQSEIRANFQAPYDESKMTP